MKHSINTPLDSKLITSLHAGDEVYISGTLYTARDAAHKRMVESLKSGESLPFSLKGAVIYYTGPTPAPEGKPIGSAGPTTSYRMDDYTPFLLEQTGLAGMIGKGGRSNEVRAAIVAHNAVYFAAIGGAGALISNCIISSEVIAYEDLGPEAVRRLCVKDLPLVVAHDAHGESVYAFL